MRCKVQPREYFVFLPCWHLNTLPLLPSYHVLASVVLVTEAERELAFVPIASRALAVS